VKATMQFASITVLSVYRLSWGNADPKEHSTKTINSSYVTGPYLHAYFTSFNIHSDGTRRLINKA